MEIIIGRIERPLKTVLYGPEGIGKSTFASKFPDPLFIDTEGSTDHMDVKRLAAPTSWQMLLSQIEYVKKAPDICRTLVIDTADWAERLAREDVLSAYDIKSIEAPGYGKGYTYLAERWGKFLNLLSDVVEAGKHVVITAHAQMRKFEEPSEMGAYDRWELKLEKKTAPLTKEWADLVLFANYKINVVQNDKTKSNKAMGGKRVMYTSHHPAYDAKNRHGLPDELPLDFKAISVLFAKSINPTQDPAPDPASTAAAIPEPKVEKESTPESAEYPEGVPQKLVDLMRINAVTAAEMERVIGPSTNGGLGYVPSGVTLGELEEKMPGFCDYIVANWNEFADHIKYTGNPLPFDL